MENMKSPIKMSSRLHKVADMITPGLIVADIGTDHGYIPIYQVLTGKAHVAYACDVAEGPLSRAADNIRLYNVGDKVKTVLSDGLCGLTDIKADAPEAIVIAGMGGSLICRILADGSRVAAGAKELVLSPHSEWYEVRLFLQNNCYRIVDEDMLKEDGKYYVIMRAEHAGSVAEHLKDEELKFGPVLMKKRYPVLMDYLKKEKDTCEKIKKNLADNAGESARSKIDEFEKKEALLDGVLGKLMEV